MLVGIDTGGTYTDAVLFDPDGGADGSGTVSATAKARTRPDLSIGIKEALTAVVADPEAVSLVALSTTLATNALVEGVGGRVATVLVGFDESSEQRAGLADAVGNDPVIRISGGHNSMGVEAHRLDLDALRHAVAADPDGVDAFAVAALFSVRNPVHENAVRDLLAELTGKPIACSHELSAKLNGPKRALTCLLNSRLLGLIAELGQATTQTMEELGIDAPLMLVRGDGSLVSAPFAMNRPIETILSGPAASLVGANYLISNGISHAVANSGPSSVEGPVDGPLIVSDIGGTTTDIGIVYRGVPKITADGAVVGGHKTMVEAVDMFTVGLGGDSEVNLDRGTPPELKLGPRRITPLSLAAVDDSDIVHRTLDSRTAPIREIDTIFARATGRRGAVGVRERKVLDRLNEHNGHWAPVTEVAASSVDATSLTSLVRRGLAQRAGFTPSDAAHVLGLHDTWDGQAALKAADLIAATTDGRGDPVRPDGKAFAQWVFDALIHQSAHALVEAALTADGYPAGSGSHELARASLRSRMAEASATGSEGELPDSGPDPVPPVSAVSVGVATPIVALGASAATYYPDIARALGTTSLVPEHAEVANAVGAVVGQVRLRAQCTVSQPSKGQYRVHWPGLEDRGDLQPALDDALAALHTHLQAQAAEAGAAEIVFADDVAVKSAKVEGRDVFVEATVTVTATGRPKLA